MVTQETEKNIKFAHTICLQNHTSQHKADLISSKLHLTLISFLFRESAVTNNNNKGITLWLSYNFTTSVVAVFLFVCS